MATVRPRPRQPIAPVLLRAVIDQVVPTVVWLARPVALAIAVVLLIEVLLPLALAAAAGPG